MKIPIPDGSSFLGYLTTKGRVTGKERTVKLRLVFHGGRFYASRRNLTGDWLKNVMTNPSVSVEVNGTVIDGLARLVEDDELSRKISELKYNDIRREESRVVVEITPIE
jgi:deazaflavin-dependent oxidoreductase (nitroreductase family)